MAKKEISLTTKEIKYLVGVLERLKKVENANKHSAVAGMFINNKNVAIATEKLANINSILDKLS